jgi:hypothetical protein
MPHVHKTLIRRGRPIKKMLVFPFYPDIPRGKQCVGLKTWLSIFPSKQGTNFYLLHVEKPHENVEKDLKSVWPHQNVLKKCSKDTSKL